MSFFEGPLLLLCCTLVELVLIKFVKKDKIPWREVIFNLNSGHILMWILRGLEVVIFAFVLNNFSLGLVPTWPLALQWIFTFFAWDFCFYCLHYFHHKIPLFWSVHVIHHQGEHFGLSLGIRNSWYSSVTSIPFFLILAVLGVPLEIFIPVSAFHYFVQFYNHNNIVNKSGILEYFMVTPSCHRVHHGINPEYIDKNCGGTFNFWDKIFGTYQKELDDVQIQYGVLDESLTKTDNPFWANNIPLFQYLKIKMPKLNLNENKIPVSDMYIASGGLILFGIVIYYIALFGQRILIEPKEIVFFTFIFVATIANGSSSDGRFSGLVSWIIISTIPTIAFILYYQVFEPIPLMLFALFFLHGLYGIKELLNSKKKDQLQSLNA